MRHDDQHTFLEGVTAGADMRVAIWYEFRKKVEHVQLII